MEPLGTVLDLCFVGRFLVEEEPEGYPRFWMAVLQAAPALGPSQGPSARSRD